MGEEHSSINCALYFARLLRKIAGRTRLVLSVLKSSRRLRRRVSVEKRGLEEHVKSVYWDSDSNDGKDFFSVTPPAKKKTPSSWRSKKSCYLCRAKYKKIDAIEAPSPPRTPESLESLEYKPRNIKYLPITRTQPPNLPLRTTSLPCFKKLRRLALTTHPSAPLSHFILSQEDSASFQWLVLAHADKYGLHEFMDPIWNLVLEVANVEPCVQHAVLAVAAMRESFRYGSNSWNLLCSQHQRRIIRHCTLAIRGLQSRLSGATGKGDTLLWDISFITSYLFTVLQLALRNDYGARFWLKSGYRILKHAFRAYEIEPHSLGLPASLKDVAWAFVRLNTRSITI